MKGITDASQVGRDPSSSLRAKRSNPGQHAPTLERCGAAPLAMTKRDERPADEIENRPLWQRLAWMAAIWAGSVAVLGTVAMLIRWWLGV